MKKLDLHIHTVPTISDADFSFDMSKLKEYVIDCKLDAIAITNHNVFDLTQFNTISALLSIPVFPGIEINLETGHMLLLAEKTDAIDFDSRCLEITSQIKLSSDAISLDDFKRIFSNLGKYLLIPHYRKSPEITEDVIDALQPYIQAGEVDSPKKFIYCLKDSKSLVPVYFSDTRISGNLDMQTKRQTFVNCGNITIGSLKNSLSDKGKVSLSKSGSSSMIQIFKEGLEISSGLNVIAGERSSGKSHTLKRIYKENPMVKYVPQFSLVESDDKNDEVRFNRMLSGNQSLFTQNYLKDFQSVVADMLSCDLEKNDLGVSNYIESLKKHASESERFDAFSKARLFSEEEYVLAELKGLTELIDSVQHLIENIEYRPIIKRHIDTDNLKELIIELMQEYAKREKDRLIKIWVNDLVIDIRKKLRLRTAATTISEVDLYRTAMDIDRRNKFTAIVEQLRDDKVIMEKSIQGFKVIAAKGKHLSVTDLKNAGSFKGSLASIYQKYNNPYDLLKALRATPTLPAEECYRYFVKIQYSIINKDGYGVSGGERSEFNLLQEIEDAQCFEMLLIDEPESSFDNIFLKNEVNALIKEIAATMPVVIVTHNNTVGMSIRPDYLLYTKKDKQKDKVEYSIYSGYPTDKSLKSIDGRCISNINVTMGCFEGGEDTYHERRRIYESIES